jgi:alkylhydroperoxidase family enzyme
VASYNESPSFSPRERLALEYADAMTVTGHDVSDDLFNRIRQEFSEEELIVLTEVIAWENASSKFNRAFRVPSQQLWKRVKPLTP